MPHGQMSHPAAHQHPAPTKKPHAAAALRAKPKAASAHLAHHATSMPATMEMTSAATAHNESMNMDAMPDMAHGDMQMADQPPKAMDQGQMTMPAMAAHHGHSMAATPLSLTRASRSTDYSQGRDFGPIHPPMMMGNDPLYSLSLKRLEWLHSDGQNQGAYEFEGWWGTDWNRAVLKAEGDFDRHALNEARIELLWRRPQNAYWNTELGVRQDSGNRQDRTWLALGVNGIAPYFVDIDTTLYVRDQLHTALIVRADYDLRLTQRLILQPRVEAELYGKTDRINHIGSGISALQAGLRLRYEFSRQFAPYLGVEATRHYGQTASLLRQEGERTGSSEAVAGLMLWF